MATVVIGYVPRPEGEAALAAGIEEARRRHADVLVVQRPVEDERAAQPGGAPSSPVLAGIAHELRSLPRGAELAEELVAAASGPDDLIVIGIRRRTATGKLILGTSAQHVLLDAACPVLTVKAVAG